MNVQASTELIEVLLSFESRGDELLFLEDVISEIVNKISQKETDFRIEMKGGKLK